MATWKPEDEPVYDWAKPSAAELRPYRGQWIAYDGDGKIRASGKTPKDVTDLVDAAGLTDVTYSFIPDGLLIGGTRLRRA